jgi:hypothetical protein
MQYIQSPWSFGPFHVAFFPQELKKIEKQSENIGIKITCIVRFFCMWKEAYALYKYKAQVLQETSIVIQYHHVCKYLSS